MNNVWTLLENWWRKPFNPEGDVVDWFLTFGLIVIVFFFWGRVVNKIA